MRLVRERCGGWEPFSDIKAPVDADVMWLCPENAESPVERAEGGYR